MKDYKNYSITTPDKLRKLFVDANLCTLADEEQYQKIFSANEAGSGMSFRDIAVIIWICSEGRSVENIVELLLPLFFERNGIN